LEKDITILVELAETMASASLCGLGQAAPVPVVDSLQYFRGAYDNRIRQS
jgi:NADH:ubiquinone oxidoreductase subunit F (NADH-binding)